VIAFPAIDRTDDGELVEHPGEFGKVFTDDGAGQFRLDDAEWPAIFGRPVRFRVKGVDLAGAARHPQEDNGFRRAVARRSAGSGFQQSRQVEPSESREPRFKKVAAR
jgi:hypothetical protein